MYERSYGLKENDKESEYEQNGDEKIKRKIHSIKIADDEIEDR